MLIIFWHGITIPLMITVFCLMCAIPPLWPIIVPYLFYVSLISDAATNGKLAWRSEFMRRLWIWKAFAAYFPARLHKTVDLPPTRKYVFGYHPHGIISHGAFIAFATEALGFSRLFPGITNSLLTLDPNFRLPFYREYILSFGVASVSRESCKNILTKGGHDGLGMGRALTIVVGGARESLYAEPGTMRLILKQRRGFIKLAVQTGADLVPVIGFGENDIYQQLRADEHPYVHKAQLAIKKLFGFTVPVFHARGVFNYDAGFMPYRRPLNIMFGKPIPVVQQQEGEAISKAYIDELHAKYTQELKELFERGKEMFDVKANLEIID